MTTNASTGTLDHGAARTAWPRVLAIVALALLLHTPALSWGFLADDYVHQAVFRHEFEPAELAPWNLYAFGSRPEPGSAAWETQCPTWWTSADWKVSFFRPLTSLTLWLDFELWGDRAWGYALDGLIWYALLLVLAYALFRELGLRPRVAEGALLLFAVEAGSFIVVGWSANRNTVIETLFTLAAVLFAARGTRRARPTELVLALLCASAALLSKESGLGAFLLIAATMWFGPSAARGPGAAAPPRGRGLVSAACFVLPALHIGWLLGAGYGAHTPFYPVPWSDPLGYAARVLFAVPVAVLSLATPIASDIFHVAPQLRPFGLGLALLLGVPLVLRLRRALANEPAAPLFAAWFLVTLLPRANAPISDRMVFLPAVGAAALFACFLAHTGIPWPTRWRRVLLEPDLRWAALLFYGAGCFSALDLLSRAQVFRAISAESRAIITEADVGDPSLGRREVLLLQSPNSMAVLSAMATWVVETGDREVRMWALQLGRRALRLTRESEYALRIESLDEPFFTAPFEDVFLSSHAPPTVGERWRTSAFEVEALEVESYGLRRLRLTFERSLDDPRVRLLFHDHAEGRDAHMAHLTPPPVGATIEVAAAKPLLPFTP